MLVRLRSFERAGAVAVWIDWIEVGRLSLRFAVVSGVGIGQGTIVDCGGYLRVGMVGFVGYRVGC